MKLVIISPFPPYRGGIAKETQVLYHCIKKNHNVKIINFKRQYPSIFFPGKTQYEKNNQININNSDVIRLIDSINPITWRKTVEYIIDNKFDRVVFRFWHPFIIPAYYFIANKLSKNNIQTYCICDNVYPHENFPFKKLIVKIFFNKINKFFVMSDKTYNQLKLIINENKIKKIYLPIDNKIGLLVNKTIAQEKINFKSDFVLLFFGLIREYKGLDILIKSLSKINDNIKLLIVGECYEDENKYLNLIDKYNLNSRVKWINNYIPEKDVNIYFSSCDVVVLPYKRVTQSGIISIAYNFNKIILCSDLIGINDFVINGKTGYTFEPENYKSLAERIMFIYKNHDFSVSKKYIENFKKNFKVENLTKEMISFME